MPTDEHVLCIGAGHFAAVGAFTGFRPADPAYRDALLDPAAFTFRPRSQVETDPEFKQLIPYVLLRHGDHLFHYRRGASGTEARLRARRSVGVGGHISLADAGRGDPYRAGMLRELHEEVAVGPFTEGWLGFIYDPRTPVGRVHLGVVHVFDLAEMAATPREGGISEAGFAAVGELWDQREGFETWSQLALEPIRAGHGA
jgi:predicted NUDIX family phosphoesterase